MKKIPSGFQKWREQTSISPFKRHLGNYKHTLIPNNNSEDSTIKYFNVTMLSIHNTMINVSLSIEISLERWIKSEVIMIPKEKQTTKINRRRVINKYETDYHLVLTCYWPESATIQSNRCNILGENQWETCPKCSAEHPAILDEIKIDIHQIACPNRAKLQNNTTTCYERMVINLTALCSRFHHIPD